MKDVNAANHPDGGGPNRHAAALKFRKRIHGKRRRPMVGAANSLGRVPLDRPQHAGLRVAVDVLEVLVRGVEHRDLVIEREVLEFMDVAHERHEDLQMGGMRLSPMLEIGERVPKADAEPLFLQIAMLIHVMAVAVGVAAYLEAAVADKVHTLVQNGLDVLVPYAALFVLGSAPVLA